MDISARKLTLVLIVSLVSILILVRLAFLQLIITEEYGKESVKNAIKKITLTPARGLMYDRNLKVIVDNKPSYTLTVTPSDFDTIQTDKLSKLINESPEYIKTQLKSVKGTNRFNPLKIKRDIDFKIISVLEEESDDYKGVNYEVDAIRIYPNRFRASHIFGYTKEISEKQLQAQKGIYYRQGDLIGSSGLEKFYENYLRGEKGFKFISVDVKGREVASYNEGKDDISPVRGSDLYLTIDSDLQEYAEKLMNRRRGAVIAVDPRNGEILCYVSKPDYDPSLFSGPTKPKLFAELISNTEKPLFDRVIQTKYPPGSTWKPLMSMAGLASGKITITSTISCPGAFTYGNRTFDDHGAYGSINVVKAIEVSANVFFYKLSLMIGLENYTKYGKMFGFGSKTGIDMPVETNGLLPSVSYFDKVYGQNKWTQGLLVSLGIGQGELGVSPVQMVAFISSISMNGLYCQPHLVRKIYKSKTNSEEILEFNSRIIDIPQKYYEAVRRGLYLVVNGVGTAKNIKSSEFSLAGKTGTAQNPNGNNHSWFVGYAPSDDPKIAICVLGENAGWGNQFAAPIAAAIMVRYLSGNTQDVFDENATVKIND